EALVGLYEQSIQDRARHQFAAPWFAEIEAIQQQKPGGWCAQPRNDRGKSGLAAPGRTFQKQAVAPRDAQRTSSQDGFGSLTIAEDQIVRRQQGCPSRLALGWTQFAVRATEPVVFLVNFFVFVEFFTRANGGN